MSPRYRTQKAAEGWTASSAIVRELTRAPPFVAVLALFRSMGYRVKRFQADRWIAYTRNQWCAFTVEKNGETRTRWARCTPVGKIEINDGRDVPRELKLRYAIARTRAWDRKWQSELGTFGKQ